MVGPPSGRSWESRLSGFPTTRRCPMFGHEPDAVKKSDLRSKLVPILLAVILFAGVLVALVAL